MDHCPISLYSTIHTNLIQHYTLLSSASRQLELNTESIRGLEKDIGVNQVQLELLEVPIQGRRKRYLNLRDSKIRRGVYTLVGHRSTFEDWIQSNERAHVDLLEEQARLKIVLDTNQKALKEALKVQRWLQDDSTTLDQVRQALDAFYDYFFSETILKFPGEEDLRRDVSSSGALVAELEAKLERETVVLQLLGMAEIKLEQAVTKLCLGDDWGRVQARAILGEGSALVDRASEIQPQISKWTDDGPLTGAECVYLQEQLERELAAEQRWVKSLTSGLTQARRDLEYAQDELREMRRCLFDRMVSQDSRPPVYTRFDSDKPPEWTE